MFNDSVCIMNNIAIVQSQDIFFDLPPTITANDLPKYYGTVKLAVVKSKPIIEGEASGIELLFGSWVESEDEDAQLEKIYRFRTIPPNNITHE